MKVVLYILGWFSVVLGVVGIFLPLLPTTPFLLLATWCFYKSSPKAHAWIQAHPTFGPIVRDWNERGVISRKSKVIALSTIAISVAIIWYRLDNLYLKVGVTAFLMGSSTFIATRSEK